MEYSYYQESGTRLRRNEEVLGFEPVRRKGDMVLNLNTKALEGIEEFGGTVIDAALRTLSAIDLLAQRDLSASELAHELGVDRGAGRRLLNSLVAAGYARALSETAKYSIDPARIVHLASIVRSRYRLTDLSATFVAELRDTTGETSQVAVRMGNRMVLVQQERSHSAVAARHDMSRLVPMHSASVGKALMAFLDESEVDTLLTKLEFTRYTPNTLCSPGELRTDLKRIRERGYAIDNEERELGMRCLAAPIRGPEGKVVASIGISAPSSRLSLDDVPNVASSVVAAAEELSTAIGYSPAR